MKRLVVFPLLLALTSAADARPVKPTATLKDYAAMIANALAAAPAHVAREAGVVAMGPGGEMRTLRDSKNGFVCVPDDPKTTGNDPMCADEQGTKWMMSWMHRDAKPANDQPGIAYMLQGVGDMSTTDPWQEQTAKPNLAPPHMMLLWPFDPKKTGLSDKPQKTGTWIMWAGTPYAHLMVNGNPVETRR